MPRVLKVKMTKLGPGGERRVDRQPELAKKTLQSGMLVSLPAVRANDQGVFLSAGTGNTSDDILLHKNQQSRPVEVGETVEVFLYTDPGGRLCASMRLPRMRIGQVARAEVLHNGRDGAYVEVGAERGIFLPRRNMNGPAKVGDRIWIKLIHDNNQRLILTTDVAAELQKAALPATDKKVGDWVEGVIYNRRPEGYFIFTTERNIAFLHSTEVREALRCGEDVKLRVTFVREDGRLNVSLRPAKETAMDDDVETILMVLGAHEGAMPYGDKTAPAEIEGRFRMSKAAFKRALGRLMKAGQIEQRDGWTYLRQIAEQGDEQQ